MAADRAKTLARLHRVRTLQLNLKLADEATARDRFSRESALTTRIAELADAVSPVPSLAAGFSLGAQAHYRERLHHSAAAAGSRMRTAQYQADQASEATKAAKRDQSAVEKLMARADKEAVLKEIRAMEDAPAFRRNRHDPC
ncbi:hypothetical protein ASE75_00355 [Sphingomonas sp. Leaf17]|uniref:hypothetical protein n=1 Tax=Sphingomonas sp. Leaf17 TaxID=1735683 RepID=UPI0006F28DC6|nr:hypothetical protein [Sphingomonas sp. Leaf17]KQM67452.1 hypothetical protein ASE75_00355 [Sphingomonas sp. Leaf17]